MDDLTRIAGDPEWFVHRFDWRQKRVQFIRLSPEQMRAETFLADAKPRNDAESLWVPAEAVSGMSVPPGSIHFVFHTAFCRSTLLARALDIPELSFGLSEPAILNDLAVAGRDGASLLKPVLSLLARPVAGAPVMVVKPSNFANNLLGPILQEREDAKAILLSGSLAEFLRSVHRKGLMGRRWGRKLYGQVSRYAPLDLGLGESGLFELTDLQVAALGWFLQQRHFALALASPFGPRLATLDSDALVSDRLVSLEGVDRFFALGGGSGRMQQVADGAVFTSHAKLGGDYASIVSDQQRLAESEVVEEEIRIVGEWVGAIVAQTGLALPVSRPVTALQ